MNPSEPQRIEDILAKSLSDSARTLMTVLGLGSPVQLEAFQKILASMRGLPVEAQTDIVIPLIQKQCAVLGIDPTKDHAKVAAFSDIIALSIQDATGMIIANMEHNAKSASALRSGRGSMLIQ